jgi:hypothetical protein
MPHNRLKKICLQGLAALAALCVMAACAAPKKPDAATSRKILAAIVTCSEPSRPLSKSHGKRDKAASDRYFKCMRSKGFASGVGVEYGVRGKQTP